MSVPAMRAAWRDSVKLPHADTRVLLALAWFAGDDGETFVSQATIAELTGLHVGNVRRRIADLTARGLVRKLDRVPHPGMRGRGTIRYRVAVDNAVNSGKGRRANARRTSASSPRGNGDGIARGSERIARQDGSFMRVVAGRADSENVSRTRAHARDVPERAPGFGPCPRCGQWGLDCRCGD